MERKASTKYISGIEKGDFIAVLKRNILFCKPLSNGY